VNEYHPTHTDRVSFFSPMRLRRSDATNTIKVDYCSLMILLSRAGPGTKPAQLRGPSNSKYGGALCHGSVAHRPCPPLQVRVFQSLLVVKLSVSGSVSLFSNSSIMFVVQNSETSVIFLGGLGPGKGSPIATKVVLVLS